MEKELNGMKVVTKESVIFLKNVFDWIKGENRIPSKLENQLTHIPYFSHLNKDVEDIDIEIAYYTYRSSTDSTIGYDDYGFPIVIDPHDDELRMLFRMKDMIKELNKEEFVNPEEK